MRKTVLLLTSLTLSVLLASGIASMTVSSQATAADRRPNVVVVMSDDQNEEEAMSIPRLVRFGRGGATFSKSFVTNSLCCPSRATFLRSQYSNNHGTITNWAPSGAYPRFVKLGRHKNNLVTQLSSAGYRTAHYGTYLNGYAASNHGKPPGWDRFVFVSNSNKAWDNGAWRSFTAFHDDYATNRAVMFIRAQKGRNVPFYVQLDLHSPHAPYDVPGRNKGVHANDTLKTKPSFSEDLSDKPKWVRDTREWSRATDEPARLKATDANRRKRLDEGETVADALQAVDQALRDAGKYRKTYVIFTSDNGYMLGEHGLPMYKQPPYEESIRVPLMIRGPGIAAGTKIGAMVTNNDLAPTILDWAKVNRPSYMDGRSLAPLVKNPGMRWRSAFLVEHWVDTHQGQGTTPPRIPLYKMVRTSSGEVYVEYSTGEREYYNLRKDPYQMENGATDLDNAGRLARLRAKLQELKECSGNSCRTAEGG